MFDLASLFSSKAKWKVLRTLFHQSSPLPLRHIAALSDASLFSVQRVLQQLAGEELVFKKRKGQYALFSLNAKHPYYPLLVQLFDLEMNSRIAFSSNDYHRKAKSLLDFSCSAQNLLREARAWN